MFTAPGASSSSDVKPADLEGHLLVVEPLEYVENIPTSMGEKDAVRVTVHDISEQMSYEDILWFPRVLVGSLKGRIGQKVLAVLGKGTAKPGQSAPWLLIDATTQGDAVQAATAYMNGLTAAGFTTAEPAVQELAEQSKNPMLAAALGKLGATKA
jgi:hypothetical protein